MAKIELRSLIARLNPACRHAMEEAASLCVANGHREVAIEHLLVALLNQASNDMRIILQSVQADPDSIKADIMQCFQRFRQGSGSAPVFAPLLVELLQDAFMLASLEFSEPHIRGGSILLALLQDIGRYAHFEYGMRLERLPADHIRKNFLDILKGSVETPVQNVAASPAQKSTQVSGETALSKYAHCFTEAARNGKIDPVFCRDEEIRQIVDILARRRKNNPICVGEAGVGKTAVVEGLALKIIEGDVPDSLLGADVYGLDMGALQAGASVKGEFEKRLKAVLDEVKNADHQLILFIDEAHTLIGAGGQAGGSDAANLLKPALARGEIKTIAATTWSEYKKYFEKDPALTRRFQLVKLDEPSVEQAAIIIRGLVPAYEKAHQVYIRVAGVEAAARLSARYITGRQLPDKAIDVLDTACARVKASFSGVPAVIDRMNREVQRLTRESEALKRDARAGVINEGEQKRIDEISQSIAETEAEIALRRHDHKQQLDLVKELQDMRANKDAKPQEISALYSKFAQARNEHALVSLEVGAEEIASVIADWTGIPVHSMTQDEMSRLLNLSQIMGETIKGQDHALAAIEEHLQSSKLDLHKSGRPLGVFLLVGPSGVGKTETALELARQLFGSEQFMTTVNMTEYQEKHSLSRLIGSPPGYVGYGEGGILTEAIRKKPYSVVLLDEVEKADPDVLNLFYQAFDKGDLNDGEGRQINCKNVVFFLTSNLASDEISHFAFEAGRSSAPLIADASAATEEHVEKTIEPSAILEAIRPRLAQYFKPALLARMQPLVYLPLSDKTMGQIVLHKLDELAKMLGEKHGIGFEMTGKAVDFLRSQCSESASGARLVDQVIQRRLLPEISRAILQCGLDGARLCKIIVDCNDAREFAFDFEAVANQASLVSAA